MWTSARLSDLAKASFFYAIALALCVGVTVLASWLGSRTLLLAMFIPLVSVMLMQLVVTRDGYTWSGWNSLGVSSFGLRGWGLALLLPLLVLGFAYAGAWMSGVARFEIPSSSNGVMSFALELIASIAVVTLSFGFAEEVGWRGYLLPHLTGLGIRPALLLSGLLHGVWHLPFILWTPLYHEAGSRLVVVPLFLLTLTMGGVCYGYLRLTTGSIWPAAIAHSAFNLFWERFNACSVTSSPAVLEYLAGESGILTLLSLSAAAGWLTYRLRDFERTAQPANERIS